MGFQKPPEVNIGMIGHVDHGKTPSHNDSPVNGLMNTQRNSNAESPYDLATLMPLSTNAHFVMNHLATP